MELGQWIGKRLAPVVEVISRLRHARMFHPAGVLCEARVIARSRHPVAARLSGPALVRLSGALWKDSESWDLLGIAVRFAHVREPLSDGDQDLLFATILRPWTMGLSMLTTRPHDFLANDYNAVSPFAVAEMGRKVELRLRPIFDHAAGSTRAERLHNAISDGRARFVLEWAPYRRPWQILDDSVFEPLVELELTQFSAVDQSQLAFNPFRDGRGFSPVGLIHSIRRAVYPASQRGRGLDESASKPLTNCTVSDGNRAAERVSR